MEFGRFDHPRLARWSSAPARIAIGVLAAGAALWAAYPDVLSIPFGNDDYIMLARTHDSPFWSWWGRRDLFVGWWRPWSRETHVGWLQSVFGINEPAFHIASLLLVGAVTAAYALFARRLAGPRAGALALCGVVAMSAWSYPMLVASGAQELWMLLGSVLALWAWTEERRTLAVAGFIMALTSKETAALLPVLFVSYDLLLAGRSLPVTLRRAVVPLLVLLLWVAWHPHLGGSSFARMSGAESATGRAPQPLVVASRTLRALVSIDVALASEGGWRSTVRRALPVAICLLVALGLLHGGDERAAAGRGRVRLAAFVATWAMCGWAPLLMPALGWHAYYSLYGALGAWLLFGVALNRLRLSAAGLLVVTLALLAAARNDTPTRDWADAWSIRRGAEFMRPLRASLMRELPSAPAESRLYFTGIPAGIGFMTGDGPMFRTLYHQPKLRAAFLASWTPRVSGEPSGEDFFFRCEAGRELHRMTEARLPDGAALDQRHQWMDDQRLLGRTFARAGDFGRAAAAFDRVAATIPTPGEDAIAATEYHQLAGHDSAGYAKPSSRSTSGRHPMGP